MHSLLEFAFDGVVPETEDPFLSAFYSAAIPTIKASMRNVKNGQKSGSDPTIRKSGLDPTIRKQQNRTEQNGTEQNRNKQNRKNISYVTPSYDSEAFKEEAQHVPVYKPKEGA